MRGVTASVLAAACAAALSFTTGEAHKPITSPFTFNEDVFPIVRERCGACHAPGGVAPMSLLTHGDAVPWGESIRAELMAGHMPPWGLDSAAARFRNIQGLTARELNVLLTWASGGTPAGEPDNAPVLSPRAPTWPLGPPDATIPLPEATLGEEQQEHVAEIAVPAGLEGTRWLRAVDFLPGTPAIVRGATVSQKSGGAAPRLLALWVPGEHPVAVDDGAGFRLPGASDLVVAVRYRKTWEYERKPMSDRSQVGLYFAREPATDVRTLAIGASGVVVSEPLRALAIHPDPALTDAAVTVTATRPDKTREELIALRARAGWARRYWFRDPVALPKGTRIDVQAQPLDDRLLPPGALPPSPQADRPPVRIGLDVIPAN
jgi:hypothetical protein